MQMNLNKFYEAVDKNKTKEPWLKNSLLAFFMGGLIGIINQGFIDLYMYLFDFEVKEAMSLSVMSIILITAILTVTGVYKKIANIFKAGLFVPTTGFANSVTSSAIEGKDEGLVVGLGSKIFVLAGSVIAYGVVISTLFLLVYYILTLFGVYL